MYLWIPKYRLLGLDGYPESGGIKSSPAQNHVVIPDVVFAITEQ